MTTILSHVLLNHDCSIETFKRDKNDFYTLAEFFWSGDLLTLEKYTSIVEAQEGHYKWVNALYELKNAIFSCERNGDRIALIQVAGDFILVYIGKLANGTNKYSFTKYTKNELIYHAPSWIMPSFEDCTAIYLGNRLASFVMDGIK